MRASWMFLIALPLLLLGLGRPAPERAPRADPLQRVALIGASATTGFGTRVRLADGLARVLGVPVDALIDLSNERFFLDPDGRAARMADEAARARPTLVVGLDYLFWHGYGRVEGSRLERLERGLARLEALRCPLLLGLLPDMRAAVAGILGEAAAPGAAELRELNARIERWAAARPHVELLPLDAWVEGVRARRPFVLQGGPWPDSGVGELLQGDALHPTPVGIATLAVLIGARLREASMLPGRALELDPRQVLAHLEAQGRARAEQRLRERRERLERRRPGPGAALATR